MINGLRDVWERASLYLPAILMGVLALGAYWLVRSTPQMVPAALQAALKHEPDYVMTDFSVKTFDGTGRLSSEIFGDHARHYPDTDTLEIDAVRIRSFDELGRLTTATANRALTTGDASEVELFGQALVVRDAREQSTGPPEPRMEFRGEYLHVFRTTERITSDQPVELIRGGDRFTADEMELDQRDRVLQLKGRVKGTLLPEAVK